VRGGEGIGLNQRRMRARAKDREWRFMETGTRTPKRNVDLYRGLKEVGKWYK